MKLIIMRCTLNYLSNIFWWPKSEKSTRKKPLVMSLLITSLFILSCCIRLIQSSWKPVSNRPLLGQNIISVTGALYFSIAFLINRKFYSKTLFKLSNFKKFKKPPNFEDRNKQLDKLSRKYLIVIHSILTLMFSWPAINTEECEIYNQQASEKEVCGLISPVWLPIDFSYVPVKHLVYAWECYSSFVAYGSASVFSFTVFESIEHLIIRIHHLKMMALELVEEKNCKKRQKLLVKWVHYHSFIYKIGEDLGRSFRYALFVYVVVSSISLGFLGYLALKSSTSIDSLMFFLGWLLALFVGCYAGQHIIDESTSVAYAMYNSKWFFTDSNFCKNVMIIMIRSQRPIFIESWPLGTVSNYMLLSVLRTAYSYIGLLNATS